MEINIEELKKDIEQNRKDRLWFVDLWAGKMKGMPDKEWSQQQNVLINSMMQNAKYYPLSKDEYLKTKEIVRKAFPRK